MDDLGKWMTCSEVSLPTTTNTASCIRPYKKPPGPERVFWIKAPLGWLDRRPPHGVRKYAYFLQNDVNQVLKQQTFTTPPVASMGQRAFLGEHRQSFHPYIRLVSSETLRGAPL